MSKIKAIIDEIAKTDVTVLINGESGVGKELVAQTIHLHSLRREKPFVKVNCATIPKNLLESELFGFEKGAFTGAYIKKPGKFELANGGTILFSDINEMDVSIQAKLLQVMQDGVFSRLGGEGDVTVDVRVIATTKDHLKKSIMEGRFREDLFFRINVINLTIPPLRERREQITSFLQYYFNFYTKKYKKDIPPFSPKLIQLFKEYHWPGNIRELENLVKRVVVLGEEGIASQYFTNKKSEDKGYLESFRDPFSENVKAPKGFNLKEIGRKAAEIAEKDLIKATLQETHWNRKEAAQLLRVSYKALLYKIQKYHLNNRTVTRGVKGELDESLK